MGEGYRRIRQDPTWGQDFESWGQLFQPNLKIYVSEHGLTLCNFLDLYKDLIWFEHRVNLALARRAESLALFAVRNSVSHAIDTRFHGFLPIEQCDRYTDERSRPLMNAARNDLSRERDGLYIFGRHTPDFVGWVYHPDPTLNGIYPFGSQP